MRLVVLVAVALTCLITSCSGHGRTGHSGGSAALVAPGGRTPSDNAPPTESSSGRLQAIAAAALPPEARRTLQLIAQGGPFPYARDGVVFQNRERRLPAEPGGYYREYTVPTPGAGDRGARRIIVGRAGQRYYTPDHYQTFMIVQGA